MVPHSWAETDLCLVPNTRMRNEGPRSRCQPKTALSNTRTGRAVRKPELWSLQMEPPCTAIPLATRSAHKRIARIGVAQKVSQSPLVSEVLPGSTAHETTPAVQPIYENCKSERGYGDFKVASDKVSLSNVQESVNVSFQMRERQRYRRRRNERQ